MKTEFARVEPSSSSNPPQVRRDWSRPIVLVGFPLLIGVLIFVVRPLSHRSPTIDILGSYFPAWMICIVCGTDFDVGQPMDYSSVSPRTLRISGAAHLHLPDPHLHVRHLDHLLSQLKMHNGAVMLSEAKHLCSLAVRRWPANHQRFFASLRMTFTNLGRK
jgi:hypothetical protein